MYSPYAWNEESAGILSPILAERFGIRIQEVRLQRDGGLCLTYVGPSNISKEEVLEVIAETEEELNGIHNTL